MISFDNDWNEMLRGEFDKEYYLSLRKQLKREYAAQTVYPDMHDIFNALKFTAYKDVKAVILGQDPYHGPGQAHGLSFSVRKGVPLPPSLVNIFKELRDDLGIEPPNHGDLSKWAQEGVLLLNAVLTVRGGQPNSHLSLGWQIFTDNIISLLNERDNIVFIFWGRNAKAKESLITNKSHRVLSAAHPSPLSAYNGFFGCRHFSRCNGLLQMNGISPIDWRID